MSGTPSSDSKRYVIGDLQGCFDSLEALLIQVGFREGHDHVYLLGDIINRGPQSLTACVGRRTHRMSRAY